MRSGTAARGFASTTSGRGTGFIWSSIRSRTGWSPTANYLQFIRDGGYERPELWLSDGWAHIRTHNWTRPLYWSESSTANSHWPECRPLDPDAPVCHVSFSKPTPSRAGRSDACRRKRNGRAASTREFEWWRCAGNIPAALTVPYPGYTNPRARSANTTANSWRTRWSCAAARLPRPRARAPRTATSSTLTCAGSFGIRLAKDAE